MQAYGKKKLGSGKIHSHNECGICSEQEINKKRDRQKSKKMIKEQLEEN